MSFHNVKAETSELVEPIRLLNILKWARQTAAADRRNYRHEERTLSRRRLWHLVAPSLKQPIFIVGSPRSGTTFLGNCIAELPKVSYHFEPVATKAAARYVYSHQWRFGQASRFYRLVYAWLMRLHADGDLRFAEKTPRNCFLIDFLHQAFPDAQFVHIIRDGRDAALSHSRKPWLQAASASSDKRESSGYRYGPYPRFWVEFERRHEFETTSDIHRCIWAWQRHVSSILTQAQRLPASQYYELRYEQLVSTPEQEAKKLLDYLEFEDQASYARLNKAFSQARPDSVGGWQRALSPKQLKQVEAEAGDLLRQLGYGDRERVL